LSPVRTMAIPPFFRLARSEFDIYAHAMKASATSVIALSMLLGFAPAARADAAADYLADLDKEKVTYGDATNIVNIGNTFCRQLRSNGDPAAALNGVMQTGYTSFQTGQVARAAVDAFCPDMGPLMEKFFSSP